jgi:carboxypeptidase T
MKIHLLCREVVVMKKVVWLLFLVWIAVLSVYATQSLVVVKTPDWKAVKQLGSLNLDIVKANKYQAEIVVNEQEKALLSQKGFSYTVKIPDMDSLLKPFLKRGVKDAGKYHTYQEVTQEIHQYAKEYPQILKVESIGKSWEGRDIWAVKISDNVNKDEDEPAVLIMGMHHSREWISVEVPMALIKTILGGYKAGNERIVNLVNNREIWIVPVVNPDGFVYSQTKYKMWRKNRRDNKDGTYGVDPNRNYGYKWGGQGASTYTGSDTYRGPSAFSEKCTQAIRNFAKREHFVASISFHSYSELVLYPFGYAYNVPDPYTPILKRLAEGMAKFNHYKPINSADLYPAAGDSDDWLHGAMGVMSFTIELAKSFIPAESQIASICADNVKSCLYLIEQADNIFPVAEHQQLVSTNNYVGPYPLTVKVNTKNHPEFKGAAVNVYYKINAGSYKKLSLKSTDGTIFKGQIPGGEDYGTTYRYYIEITAGTHKTRLPKSGEYTFKIEKNNRLIVADAKGKYTEAYTEAFKKLGWSYTLWDTSSQGVIPVDEIKNYTDVVWFTGDDSASTLTEDEQKVIQSYIEQGGNIIISGQDIGYNIKSTAFYKNVLHASYLADNSKGRGLVGKGILAGYEASFKQSYPDSIKALKGGKLVITYDNGKGAGVYTQTDKANILYLAFGLEGISDVSQRAALLQKFLGADKLNLSQKASLLAFVDHSGNIFRKKILREELAKEIKTEKDLQTVLSVLKENNVSNPLMMYFKELGAIRKLAK